MSQSDKMFNTVEQVAGNMFPLQFYAQMNQTPSTSAKSEQKASSPKKRIQVEKGSKVNKRSKLTVEKVIKTPKAVKGKPNLKKIKKLFCGKRSQYIKRRQMGKSGGENLPYSGKFWYGGVQWKLHGEGGLLTSSNKFIAQVSIEQSEELDRTNSFETAKKVLLKNLKVVRVLLDEYSIEEENVRNLCDKQLKLVFANTIDNLQNAEDLYQLDKILKFGKLDCQKVGVDIKKNVFMADQTKRIISEFIEMESKHVARSRILNINKAVLRNMELQSCIGILKQNVESGINIFKNKAMGISPDFMRCYLEKLQDSHVLLVTRQDFRLFSNLSNIFRNTQIMNSMAQRYFNMILSLELNQLKAALPVTNDILFYLCKSLSDIFNEVVEKTSCTDIAQYTDNGWNQIKVIPWRSTPSTVEKSLEHQIQMLLKLMNHFDVGRSSSLQRFPYTFKVLGNMESSPDFKHIIEQANKIFGRTSDNNVPVLPDELRVWICLLDDTIAQLFSNNQYIPKLCSALLKLFLLGKLTVDSLESLRVITHNTIRLLAQAGSFVNSQNDQDSTILMKQIDFLNRISLAGRKTFVDYRDVIEVFAQYWKQRNESIDGLLAKLPGDYFKRDVEELQSLLLQCIAGALDKNVELAELKSFCRTFENLLFDLHNLPLDWFVRLPSTKYNRIFTERQALSVVGNNKQCFRVKDVEKFKTLYVALFEETHLPRHFALEAIKSQLKHINNMMAQKRWSTSGRDLTESDQLKASMGLMDLVKFSVSYFKKQPEYIDFESFLEKCTEPFVSIASKSTSLADLEVRVRVARILNSTGSQLF